MTGQAKLHINIQQGVVDVEGDAEFVWKVYEDFRARLESAPKHARSDSMAGETSTETPTGATTRNVKKSRRVKGNTKAKDEGDQIAITSYSPALDKALDNAKLAAFVGAFEPKNSAENILLFAHYLKEIHGISPCNVDQIFTCFSDQKLKIPEAFGQSFVAARGNRYGYIEFSNIEDITITIRGQNHINSGIARAKVE